MNFCPICGKDTQKTFCAEHEPVSLDYKDVVVRVCECKKYFFLNRWLSFDSLKKVCEKVAKACIKEKVSVNALIDEKIEKKKFEIEVQKAGEQFIIPAKLQVEKCPACSKIGTQYFEAVIQIRPKREDINKFVFKQIEKDDNVFVSKIVENKEGFDFFISSNKFALNIGRKLKKSFKGEFKTSRKIFGRDKQRSRHLYRATVCFRAE